MAEYALLKCLTQRTQGITLYLTIRVSSKGLSILEAELLLFTNIFLNWFNNTGKRMEQEGGKIKSMGLPGGNKLSPSAVEQLTELWHITDNSETSNTNCDGRCGKVSPCAMLPYDCTVYLVVYGSLGVLTFIEWTCTVPALVFASTHANGNA